MSPRSGRPRKEDAANTHTVTFKASPELISKLKSYCDLSERHKGEVIRTALENYLESNDMPGDDSQ